LLLRVVRVSLVCIILASAVQAEDFRAGAAAVVITPPIGAPMAGYYNERLAEGTHDDLFAKALVIEEDGTNAALVVCDLISLPRRVIEEARELITRNTGIKGDRVMISATHTHTGPILRDASPRSASLGGDREIAVEYARSLPAKIAEAVGKAEAKLALSRVLAGIGTEEAMSHNRRYFMRDGSVGWNPGKLNSNIVEAAGPIDPDVGVLHFESPDRKIAQASYVNFAMHPDTVGGLRYSADYPFTLARLLSDFKGSNMVTIFANGACGNINHVDVGWRDPQKGHGEAARLGAILAGAVCETFPRLQEVKTASPKVAHEIVKLPLPKVTEADLDKAREVVKLAKAPFLDRVAGFKALDVIGREGKPHEVEVQVITLGDEVAWVSLPGEIFVELGLAIKRASPFRYTMIAELANGSIGYIPNRAAYPQGNYEVVSARCAEGSGELLVDAAVRLLKRLHSSGGH
jgi:hypothetical protein